MSADRKKGLFASGAGTDNLDLSWQEAKELLEDYNVYLDNTYPIEFGVKEWDLKYGAGGHRAVIIKALKEEVKLAFRLELVIDVADTEERFYIAGTFTCPNCMYTTESFREYTSHYYSHLCKGDSITHNCCGEEFTEFLVYCKHKFEKHQNTKRVTLSFDKIRPDKYDEFLKDVTFFPSEIRNATFRQLLQAALSIMNNFGGYFIFFWNCQDFATWFLTYNGIPLRMIDPTVPDMITGSGSSNRSVQKTKGWMWYKKKEQMKTFQLEQYGGETVCNYPKCKYLPAMTFNDYTIHHALAHAQGVRGV